MQCPNYRPEDEEVTVSVRYVTCQACKGYCVRAVRGKKVRCKKCEGFGTILERIAR